MLPCGLLHPDCCQLQICLGHLLLLLLLLLVVAAAFEAQACCLLLLVLLDEAVYFQAQLSAV